MTEIKTISLNLPVNVLNDLETIAAEKERRFDDIINEAVLLYVDEWEESKTASRRLNDPNDPVLPEREFLNDLERDLGWDV